MSKMIDIKDQKFGYLTVLERDMSKIGKMLIGYANAIVEMLFQLEAIVLEVDILKVVVVYKKKQLQNKNLLI